MPLDPTDTSIWGWTSSGRRRGIAEPTLATRSGAERGAPLEWLPLTNDQSRRALLAQVTHGNHLRPAIDFLTATIAEAAGGDVVLWFFDKDLEIICQHTGQPYEAESASAA